MLLGKTAGKLLRNIEHELRGTKTYRNVRYFY